MRMYIKIHDQHQRYIAYSTHLEYLHMHFDAHTEPGLSIYHLLYRNEYNCSNCNIQEIISGFNLYLILEVINNNTSNMSDWDGLFTVSFSIFYTLLMVSLQEKHSAQCQCTGQAALLVIVLPVICASVRRSILSASLAYITQLLDSWSVCSHYMHGCNLRCMQN